MQHAPKNARLLEKTVDIRWMETETETEALTLESNLVRKHQPPFNVLLRDDKHFLYIVLTAGDQPCLQTARRVNMKLGTFFGPKTDAKAVRHSIDFLEKLFFEMVSRPYPELDAAKTAMRRKTLKLPDPFFAPGMSPGPALDEPAAQAAYLDWKKLVLHFLKGDTAAAEALLKSKMALAAQARNFEHAARLRDQLVAVQAVSQRQLVSDPSLDNRDVLAFQNEGSKTFVAILEVRSGKLIDQKNATLRAADGEEVEAVSAFLLQWYREFATQIPREILLPASLPETEITLLANALSTTAGHRVQLLQPQRGVKAGLCRLAQKNAAAFSMQQRARFENAESRTVQAAAELAKLLKIEKKLRRVEAYDISHLGGTACSAAMVVAENGEPVAGQYRHFSVRGIKPGKSNDYFSMAQVLRRRLSKLMPQLPAGYAIRRATLKDTIAAKELLEKEVALIDCQDDNLQLQLVCLNPDKKVVGHVCQIMIAGKHIVRNLIVCSTARKQGIGRALLTELIRKTNAKKLYLSCKPEMHDFYAEEGWTEIADVSSVPVGFIAPGCTHLFLREPGKKEDASFTATPDLIILDGGKGQLSAVHKHCRLPKKTTLVALAKKFEDLFFWDTDGNPQKIELKKDSPARFLATRLRDEAHRFSNRLRKKKIDARDRGRI